MKIIEAMNALKTTEKKLSQKQALLSKYSARPSFREDAFKKDGKDGEAELISQTIQACEDLIAQHESLKRAIDYTNLMTQVDVVIGGVTKKFTIHSLIKHKKELIRMKRAVWSSLNDRDAQLEVSQLRMKPDTKINAQVVYNFDIREREGRLEELHDLEAQVDSALQIANSRIDLLSVPGP